MTATKTAAVIPAPAQPATGSGVVVVARYFGYQNKPGDAYPSLAAFRADWDTLDDTARDQIRSGIANGTLTY